MTSRWLSSVVSCFGSKLFLFANIVLTDKWRLMWENENKQKLWLVEAWLKRPLDSSSGRSFLSCHCFHLTPFVTQNFLCASPCSASPPCVFLAHSLFVCHLTRLSGFSSFAFFLPMNAFMCLSHVGLVFKKSSQWPRQICSCAFENATSAGWSTFYVNQMCF